MTLLYSQNERAAEYTPDAGNTKVYHSSQEVVFCGSAFLKEYLAQITEDDLQQLFPAISSELFADIRRLEFLFRTEGAKIAAGNPLLTVKGNPLAIDIIEGAIRAFIGGQSAVSTAANALVRCVKGLDTDKQNLFPALQLSANKRAQDECAYLGLRRGEGGNAADDYAAWIGGFVAGANVNTEINRDKYHYVKTTMPVVGTIAHFWPMSQTALHNHVIRTKQLEKYLSCLNISAEQYAAAKNNEKLDLNDYVAFRAYIRAVESVEQKIKINTGNDVTKGVVLLVDTTDTIKGVHAAIWAVKDSNRKITGIRLDTTPEKYVLEVARLLTEAGLGYVKIYCTDGIDLGVAQEIFAKCKDVDNRLVYGIGSAVANTPALKLASEVVTEAPILAADKFCLSTEPAVAPVQINPDQIPADFYALTQSDFLHCLNDLLAQHNVTGYTHGGSTLNFRFRKDTPNYLIMAGVDKVKRAIDKFEYNEDFIKMMKSLGLSYTEEEYDRIRGKKLDVEISYVPEGSIFGPYQPGIQIKGPIDQVLFVESFVLSTIGSMSAVSTAAKELIESMKFNADDTPYFVYMPENEKRLSTDRCNAAYVGGFKATTMFTKAHGLDIPRAEIAITFADYINLKSHERSLHNKVAICRNDYPYGIDTTILKRLVNEGKVIQIIGGFENQQSNRELKSKLIESGATMDKLEFFVGEPLSSKKNEKGLVYKTDFIDMYTPAGEKVVSYTIKAAGNTKPGIKNSIPAVEQRLAILKHEGVPIASICFDAALILPGEDLLALLTDKAQLYYMNNESAENHIIARGEYDFGSVRPDSLELVTCLQDENMTANEVMFAAQQRADINYKLGLHKLPMLMENRMFTNLTNQMNTCSHKDKKLRLTGE